MSVGREEKLLVGRVRETIGRAREAENQLSALHLQILPPDFIDPPDYDGTCHWLAREIDNIRNQVAALAERLGLHQERMAIDSAYPKLANERDSYEFIELEFNKEAERYESDKLKILIRNFENLAVMVEGQTVYGLEILETILHNTPIILRDMNVTPDREAKIKNSVLKILKYSFDDAISEFSVPHLTKVYKPDIGVRSLMAAVEFKFAINEREFKTAIDGINEDMIGYNGHSDWRNFYAVIYCTETFSSKGRIDADLAGKKANMNWKIIPVYGPGARPAKGSKLQK